MQLNKRIVKISQIIVAVAYDHAECMKFDVIWQRDKKTGKTNIIL